MKNRLSLPSASVTFISGCSRNSFSMAFRTFSGCSLNRFCSSSSTSFSGMSTSKSWPGFFFWIPPSRSLRAFSSTSIEYEASFFKISMASFISSIAASTSLLLSEYVRNAYETGSYPPISLPFSSRHTSYRLDSSTMYDLPSRTYFSFELARIFR